MNVIEREGWSKFRIPIPAKENETNEEYLTRVKDILVKFYKTHTSCKGDMQEAFSPFRDGTLESLVIEHNFCSMSLSGIKYCDVKFSVGSPNNNYGNIGIDVWSHGDNVERRKPMVDFVKELWRNFSYDI